MANYLCRATNPRIPDYLVIKVSVPTGQTMHAGDVFPVVELDDSISNNYQVFTGTQPATANLGVRMAIVINDGFETLEDGRRPAGQPDYTQYTYAEGEVVTAILMVPGLVFEISNDCVTNGSSAVVGDFVEPVNGAYAMSRVASGTGRTASTKSGMKVLYVGKNFRMGGQFGSNFIQTMVCMVEDADNATAGG